MERLRHLRGTPEGKKAREAISGEVVARLAALVECAAPFRDWRARRRFGPDLRWWAYRCILDRDAALRRERRADRGDALRRERLMDKDDAPPPAGRGTARPKPAHAKRPKPTSMDLRGVTPDPLPRETREVLDGLLKQVDQARAAVGRTYVALASLDPTAREALRSSLDWPEFVRRTGRARPGAAAPPLPSGSARAGEPRAAWLGELDRAHRQLLRLARGIEAGRSALQGRSGPRPRAVHRAAIHDLAQLWLEMTGKRPTRRNDDQGKRAGPFRDFARAAMARVWPGVQSLDGLIDEACSQLGSSADPS
jgi:hypothetical protein